MNGFTAPALPCPWLACRDIRCAACPCLASARRSAIQAGRRDVSAVLPPPVRASRSETSIVGTKRSGRVTHTGTQRDLAWRHTALQPTGQRITRRATLTLPASRAVPWVPAACVPPEGGRRLARSWVTGCELPGACLAAGWPNRSTSPASPHGRIPGPFCASEHVSRPPCAMPPRRVTRAATPPNQRHPATQPRPTVALCQVHPEGWAKRSDVPALVMQRERRSL
jgi:hypothetical protein